MCLVQEKVRIFNPFQEKNFSIEPRYSNFVVRADSERFGKAAIVFESYDRTECVAYICRREAQAKPQYYVIPDLSTWSHPKAGVPLSPMEQFDDIDGALERYMKLRETNYDFSDGFTRLTLGVIIGIRELDIIHVRANEDVLIDDFSRIPAVNTNAGFLADLKQMHETIVFDTVMKRQEKGKYNYVHMWTWSNPFLAFEQ